LNLSLAGRVAIVTGASRGIGRAIAEGLASAGASVIVNHRASSAQADEVVEAIERSGGRAAAIQADMANVTDIYRLVSATIEKFGALDILVNNAGVGHRTEMSDMTEKEFDWTMVTNARGPMFAIQAAVPCMRDNGRIINISSCGTHVAQITGLLAVYQMSKGALEQLARCYMKELGVRGITINSVLPGFVETELASDTPQEYKDALIRRTALRRLGTAEEIAAAVCFLASDAARWITGEAIQVSGGLA
jgi:3-oxoacyl-[acyl-carrier protein] reductase